MHEYISECVHKCVDVETRCQSWGVCHSSGAIHFASFETDIPLGSGAHQLGWVGYQVSPGICSPPGSNSGPQAGMTSTLPTELFPRPLR